MNTTHSVNKTKKKQVKRKDTVIEHERIIKTK